MIDVSIEYYNLAENAAKEELKVSDLSRTKREVWEKMGKMLEQYGHPKNQISKTIQHTIEEILEKKTGKPLKINTGHYYAVMAENEWQDKSFARNKIDPATGADNSSYKEPKTKMRYIKDVPEGDEWDILDMMLDVSKLQVHMLEKIKQKVIINKGAILNMKGKVDTEKQEMLEKVVKTAKERRDVVSAQMIKQFKSLKNARDLMSANMNDLQWGKQHLDDRVTITHWEKIMSMIMIDIGYDRNEIARFLKVNSKHIKLNVDAPSARSGLLGLLNVLKRCPNPKCGIELHEYFEAMIRRHREDKEKNYRDYDVEPLLITGYQKEVVKLKAKLAILEQKYAKKVKK